MREKIKDNYMYFLYKKNKYGTYLNNNLHTHSFHSYYFQIGMEIYCETLKV